MLRNLEEKIETVLESEMPTKINSLMVTQQELFTYASLEAANDAFLEAAKAKTMQASPTETDTNPVVYKATVKAREELAALVETLLQLETWLTLSIPTVSDGNNFGVEIQEFVVKMLIAKKDAAKALLDGLNGYHTARADMWGKAVFPVSVKKTSSQGEKSSSGGEKDTNEKSTSKDEATSHSMVHTDALVAIAGLDTQHYFNLKMIFNEMFKTYAVVHDSIKKNMQKLKNPRGEESRGGGGGISMF